MWVGGQHHSPAALLPGKNPFTPCIGGWVGPSAGLDGYGKSRLYWGSIPGPSSPYEVGMPAHPKLAVLLLLLLLFAIIFM